MQAALSRRGALATGICGAASLMLPSCGDDGAISFWAIGNEAISLPGILDALGIGPISVQPLPWSGAHSKLLTGFVGDSLPDIAQVGNSWIAELAAIGALEPVPEVVTAKLGTQFDAVLASNRIGGRFVAVPWYVDTRVQFYRKDVFERAGYGSPPLDWAGWKAALAAIKRAGGGDAYGVLLPLDEFEHLQSMALSAGAGFLRADGTRGDFSSPAFLAALEFYKSLFDERLAPVVSGAQIANRWAEFARGWYATYLSGPWMIEEMRSRLPRDLQDRWGTALTPGPNGPGAAPPGGSSLVVFAEGRNRDAAWQTVARLLAPDAQLALHRTTGDLPAVRGVWAEGRLIDDPMVAPFARQLELARPLPMVPEWERVVTEMQLVAERMVRGDFGARAAAAEMDRRADAILAKRRWMLERGPAT